MRFTDTSFWVALFLSRDANHGTARAVWKGDRGPLLTSNHVLGELWTFLRRRSGHSDAVRAIDGVTTSGRVTVVHAEAAVEADAWEWLRRRTDREYSFVDATSFAIMKRRRINEALAFDGDFTAAGFVEVRP